MEFLIFSLPELEEIIKKEVGKKIKIKHNGTHFLGIAEDRELNYKEIINLIQKRYKCEIATYEIFEDIEDFVLDIVMFKLRTAPQVREEYTNCLILTCEQIEGVIKKYIKEEYVFEYSPDHFNYILKVKNEIIEYVSFIEKEYGVKVIEKDLTNNALLFLRNNDIDIEDGYIFYIV